MGCRPGVFEWRKDMKTLKCMMVVLMALLSFTTGTAVADTEHGYTRMFVFGASLIDPGNHFAVSGETAHPAFYPVMPDYYPPSYGVGGHHFSNGRTWVEVMAQEMKLTEWAKPAYRDPAFGNYAFGWARARPVDNPVMPGLGQQVQDWIANGYCTGMPMDDTLFVLDTAYADLLDIIFGADPFTILPAMVESIASNIGILYGCGARNLMVANLLPLGEIPGVPDPDQVTALAVYYNLAIEEVVGMYSGAMNTSIMDLFSFGILLLNAPEDFGLSNVAETCVTFGVLQDAYCKDRNGYFFWDPHHPTKKAHALIGEFALGQVPDLD